jgi:hypothetical protein
MTDDAELQILESAKTLLEQIPRAVCKGVDLNRTRPISRPEDLPRLALMYGEDDVIDDGLTYSDNSMELVVRAIVHETDEYVQRQLSRLRSAVHAILAADRDVGLPAIVIDCVPEGASRPDMPQRELGLPVVFRDFIWRVRYRTQAADRTQGGHGTPT